MTKTGIGVSLPRLEDARLLRGEGRYSDDFPLQGQAYAVVVRSPHAHARIVSIDGSLARKMPGVLLVLIVADVRADGLKPVPLAPAASSPPDIRLDNHDGTPHRIVRPSILAIDTVRFVGEAVAFVVADTLAEAKDAAEAVQVDYDALPPIGDIAIDSLVGDSAGVEAAFTCAAHIVRLETSVQRVTGVPMEPRAAAETGRIRGRGSAARIATRLYRVYHLIRRCAPSRTCVARTAARISCSFSGGDN